MRRLIRDVVLPVAVAIALAFVIQAAVAKPYEIPTPSMVPTIKANDRIIANRVIYRFRDVAHGDIIVFQPTEAARASCGEPVDSRIPFVKRVIGLPGDTVEVVRDGPTLVNGTPLVVDNAGPNPVQDGGRDRRTFRVPAGTLFVLGDNRPNSCDSHQWSDPFVPLGNVIGQAEVIYWPLTHATFLD
ncbi:MAG TPA: signal peptidase I [Miltoncostaeaceae bacterium]|nr:signal peptidase I [Miltoncostaeaceae bacterium]